MQAPKHPNPPLVLGESVARALLLAICRWLSPLRSGSLGCGKILPPKITSAPFA